MRLRWLAQTIGFERLFLKQGRLSCHFVADPQSSYYQSEAFTHVLQYVQTHPRACVMKQKGEKLTLSFENVKSVKEAWERLKPLAIEMPEEVEVVAEVLEEGEG
jgi:transcription-repair coupling factor (superfamily II helicase)